MQTVEVKSEYLARNPIAVTLKSSNKGTASLFVTDSNNVEFYASRIEFFSSQLEIDLSSLFADFSPQDPPRQYFLIVIFDNPTMEIRKGFHIYNGGISKTLMRYLLEKGTNIFEWKLKNSEKNFFLTTRTNSRVIAIPENEIEPLFYYSHKKDFLFFDTDFKLIKKIVFPESSPESIQSIDISDARRERFLISSKLYSSFFFTDAQTSVIYATLNITEAKETDYFIRFENSWGVYERKAIYGEISYAPDFVEEKNIAQYDKKTSDFVLNTQKKEITHKYKANLGYCSADERMFVLDLLASEKCFLLVKDREYAVKLSSDSALLESTSGDPIFVPVSIELLDVDTNISPLDVFAFGENEDPTPIQHEFLALETVSSQPIETSSGQTISVYKNKV